MESTNASTIREPELVLAAQNGDTAAFERIVDTYRKSLHAYCYRMLGSVHDADDALQDTLLGAWRGMSGFETRSSLRTWLFRIATHACVHLAGRRPRRIMSTEYGPPRTDVYDLGRIVKEQIFLEPYPDWRADDAADPESRYEQRENVELAFVAAVQHLAANQRAVLILRDVLQFSAAEAALALDTSVAAVNSMLQRARKSVNGRITAGTQHAELGALGEQGQRDLVAAFVAAWERSDVGALVGLLAEDARFSMPPLPAWFAGRDAIIRFMVERASETPWRVTPASANGQLAFALYQGDMSDGPFCMSAINVVTLQDGLIVEMTGFLDRNVHRRFGLPAELSAMSFGRAASL